MHAIVYILFSAALLPVVATVSQDPHRLIVRDVAFSLNSALPRHEYFQNSRKCPPSPMLSRMLNGRGRLGLLRLSSSGPNNVRNSAESEEEDYELVECSNYTTIRAVRYGKEEIGETFHPGVGPEEEGRLLYVQQLQLLEREKEARHLRQDFVLWDVGLGAAGNAVVAIRALVANGCPRLRVVSFDRTAGAAKFALQHADKLTYMEGFESVISDLITTGRAETTIGATHVVWEYHEGDFPALMHQHQQASNTASNQPASDQATKQQQHVRLALPAADAIMYDAFSPAKCAGMWTLQVLSELRALLDPARPCLLSTSSRSTIVRVTLLLAGFFVGAGGQAPPPPLPHPPDQHPPLHHHHTPPSPPLPPPLSHPHPPLPVSPPPALPPPPPPGLRRADAVSGGRGAGRGHGAKDEGRDHRRLHPPRAVGERAGRGVARAGRALLCSSAPLLSPLCAGTGEPRHHGGARTAPSVQRASSSLSSAPALRRACVPLY